VRDDEQTLRALVGLSAAITGVRDEVTPLLDRDTVFEGSDETGAVSVTVGGDGRVRDVVLDPDWRTMLDPFAVGAAVAEAQAVAVGRQFGEIERVGGAATEPAPEDTRRPAPSPAARPATSPPAPPDVPGPIDLRGLRPADVVAAFNQVDAYLAEVVATTSATYTARHTGRGRGRHATVTVDGGGTVVGVDLDQRWLVGASAVSVGKEIQEAIAAAYAAAGPPPRLPTGDPRETFDALRRLAGLPPSPDSSGRESSHGTF
jgi:DNA-binding protein YbaB